jgi:ubiquinone/menaquinone biosynthesis C-methylase UbiE
MKQSVRSEVWRRAQTGHLETWVQYAEKGGAHTPEREAVWRSILDALDRASPIKPGEHVLDIGCGLDTVLDFVPEVSGYTLDPLASRLSELGLNPRIKHTAGVFELLPFADRAFDRVFIMNVLDHVRSPRAGIAEIARVLKPGGSLVLSVDTRSGREYLEKRFHKWWGRVRGARTKHPWVFSIPQVHRVLHETGFEAGPPDHVPGTKARRSFFVARRAA